ncbi:hypothetical protein [Psychrobacter sp. DAB_AL43B]|uniref:hypothetical protein n=1 Tax=Psychrobacter sp. DAB_AL43B TaxID=1028416 RepID=UPI0009A9040E|nr:hypothetical protein [Psychrobacter sp. DAB_AL43B]SLJ84442.1 hypothetical protein DABAL43B_1246 [Psychrobacter sp. DAB_AL43B]
MTNQAKRPKEGVLKEEAGTTDREGFISPTIGELEHVLYFTTVPSLTKKVKEVLAAGRLLTPGAVIVWDETIGRRKGSKAVAKSWWARDGSLTAAFVLDHLQGVKTEGYIDQGYTEQDYLNHLAAAAIRTIDSLSPKIPAVFIPPNNLYMNNLRIGALSYERHDLADILIIRLNCTTNFDKAPKEIINTAINIVEYIDIKQLPLKTSGTLTNTLLTRLMDEIPIAFSNISAPL